MMITQDDKEGLSRYLLRHVTFRQLQIFEAVVRTGSYSKAAETLFLAQPTVSLQMKKLAEVVGLPLLEQAGRSLRLTDAGRDVYTAVQELLRLFDDLETRIADYKGLRRGNLRLGVVTTAKYIAPELLAAFGQQHPGIRFSMQVSNRNEIIARIQNNEDDLYIMGQVPEAQIEVVSMPFALNPLVVMAPRNHPLSREPAPLPLSAIAAEPFIIREPGSGTRNAYMSMFAAAGLQPNVVMELSSNEAIKHAVASGLGISILSVHSLALEGAGGPIEILEVEGFPIKRQWHLVYPQGKKLTITAERFLEFSIAQESFIRQRLINLWPGLEKYLES